MEKKSVSPVLGVYWTCIGRVLDDVWTAVRVIGMCIGRCMDNSHQLRDKTVCLDLGKAQHVL